MSLRDKLTKPLVLEPTQPHTHTVVFLHLFDHQPADDGSGDDESALRARVLAAKQTRDHRTLAAQFPSVRWVFPHAKKGSVLHWSNLSAAEKQELGLDLPGVPYVTQVVLQEAARAGGLDKVVLGGQGKTAEAARGAMASFPECPPPKAASDSKADEVTTAHIQKHFHQGWTGFTDLKMAGFFGMHVPMTDEGAQVTRDVRNFGIQSKTGVSEPAGVNNSIVRNTPHKFIHGGYKSQTTTWDGRRIDDFAAFLKDTVGVVRAPNPRAVVKTEGGNKTLAFLTPKHRAPAAPRYRAKEELDEKPKYAQEIMEQKAENEKQRDIILRRIEADKVERKIRQARETEARLYRAQAAQAMQAQQNSHCQKSPKKVEGKKKKWGK